MHATDGEKSAKTLRGKPCLVHTEAHIRHLAGVSGVASAPAGVVGHEVVERPHDVLLDVVVHVDALDPTGVTEVIQKLVHDKLSLIVRVTGGNDGIASFKESRDFLHKALLVLGRLLRPVVNLDGEYVKAPWLPPSGVDGIRLHQFQQVPGAGTHRIAVSRDGEMCSFGHVLSRDGTGDIAGEHRLFRDD